MIDIPFNEDFRNIIFSRETLISEEGLPDNVGKMDNNNDIYCYTNLGVVNLEREHQAPYSWYQNPCDASIFLHARQNFKEKFKNSIFRPKSDLSLGSSPPKI